MRSIFTALIAATIFVSASQTKADSVLVDSVDGWAGVTVDYPTGEATSYWDYYAPQSGYIQDNGISGEYAKAEGDVCFVDYPCPSYPNVHMPYVAASAQAYGHSVGEVQLQVDYELMVDGPAGPVPVGITSKLGVATSGLSPDASAGITLLQPDDPSYGYGYAISLIGDNNNSNKSYTLGTYQQDVSPFMVGDVIEISVVVAVAAVGDSLDPYIEKAAAYVDPYFYIPSYVPNADLYTIEVSPGVGNSPISPTPLPTALPLFTTGLAGLGWLGWRRKKKAVALAA
jgi:hypothetical protein